VAAKKLETDLARQPARRAKLQSTLGTTYFALGLYREAIPLQEKVRDYYLAVYGLEDPNTLDTMSQLATSYADAGRQNEALKLREKVLDIRSKKLGPEAPDTVDAMHNLAISYADAGRLDEALKLQEEVLARRRKLLGLEHPDTLAAMDSLASSYDAAGRQDDALGMRVEVLSRYLKVRDLEHPDTVAAMHNLAISYAEAGRHQEAIPLLQTACEMNPKDTDSSLTLATWQTWFGLDSDYEATRRRLVQQAQGTDQAETAECAAKAACLRPLTNTVLLIKALNLAQRAVELGKGSSSLPWCQLSLGLAEYRNGQYPAAERSISDVERIAGDHDDIQGIAHLFHAMTLFREDRAADARRLFRQAEAQMPPLPKDESKPIVDGRTFSHDLLIWWLAYKEAEPVLNETAAKP